MEKKKKKHYKYFSLAGYPKEEISNYIDDLERKHAETTMTMKK